jgi:hypothetical protein
MFGEEAEKNGESENEGDCDIEGVDGGGGGAALEVSSLGAFCRINISLHTS